ncbi:MAG: thioesterase family protein [Planctomycetota bacterium]
MSSVSPVFEFSITVTSDVIDSNGHVNNVAYVQWMQDAAIKHARSVIRDEIYSESGTTWMVKSHHVEYIGQAFAGDAIEITTWLEKLRKVRCTRKYEFRRQSDQSMLARGETEWVYIRSTDGKPVAIPDEMIAGFRG